MAEKKGIVILAPQMALASGGEKLNKKAAVLTKADCTGLADRLKALGAVQSSTASLAEDFDKSALILVEGGAETVEAALEAANRRTLVVVVGADGTAFYGLAVNTKAGSVDRPVDADDVALTVATILDLPITADCTAAIIYQVLKDPNLKLNEILKLQEALARMESVIERNNREPWDKHDCA